MVTGVWSKAMAQSDHPREALGFAGFFMFAAAVGPMIIALRTRNALVQMVERAQRFDPSHQRRGWHVNRPYGGGATEEGTEWMWGGMPSYQRGAGSTQGRQGAHGKQQQQQQQQQQQKQHTRPHEQARNAHEQARRSQEHARRSHEQARQQFEEQLGRRMEYGGGAAEHRAILGVERGASAAAVKRAYYRRAKAAHPDTNPDDTEAAAKFARLKVAYSALQGGA